MIKSDSSKVVFSLLIAVSLLVFAVPGASAINLDSVGFSCQFVDENGNGLSGADITVQVWDDVVGGNMLFEEEFVDATDSNGLCMFSTLGVVDGVGLVEGQEYFLALVVNGDALSVGGSPRLPFIAWFGQEKNLVGDITTTGTVTASNLRFVEPLFNNSLIAIGEVNLNSGSSSVSRWTDTIAIGDNVASRTGTGSPSRSVVIGTGARANTDAVVIGHEAIGASNQGSVVIGSGAAQNINLDSGISIGRNAWGSGRSVVIGGNSGCESSDCAGFTNSIVIGANTRAAQASNVLLLGPDMTLDGNIGNTALYPVSNLVVLGRGATLERVGSQAGNNNAVNTMLLGPFSTAKQVTTNSVSLGARNTLAHANTTLIGYNMSSESDEEFRVGHDGTTFLSADALGVYNGSGERLATEAYVDANAGGADPAGSDGQIQFNDDGEFGVDAGFTYEVVQTGTGGFDPIVTTRNLQVGDFVLRDINPSPSNEEKLMFIYDGDTIMYYNQMDDDFVFNTNVWLSDGDLFMNNNRILSLPEPTSPDHAATKAYVDANAGGVDEAENYTWTGTHNFTDATVLGISGGVEENSNVTFDEVTANSFIGDGSQLTGIPTTDPAGSDGQIQFNNNGAFGANTNFAWTPSLFTMGEYVRLSGGNSDSQASLQYATEEFGIVWNDMISFRDTGSFVPELSVRIHQELDMNNNQITNLEDPSSPQDAATKAYVDANAGGVDETENYTWTGTHDYTGATLQGAGDTRPKKAQIQSTLATFMVLDASAGRHLYRNQFFIDAPNGFRLCEQFPDTIPQESFYQRTLVTISNPPSAPDTLFFGGVNAGACEDTHEVIGSIGCSGQLVPGETCAFEFTLIKVGTENHVLVNPLVSS